jgi:ribosomal protein S18 acetylase RimI-like enzyme
MPNIFDASGPHLAPALRALIIEYVDSHYAPGELWSAVDVEHMEHVPFAYEPPDGAALIASDDQGNAVGCLLLRPRADSGLDLMRLYVKPAHRMRGHARRLAEVAFERAGKRTIHLEVQSHRTHAISLYESLGFVRAVEQVEPGYRMMVRIPADGQKSGLAPIS